MPRRNPMITIRDDLVSNFTRGDGQRVDYRWVDVRQLDREDVSILSEEYGVNSEFLADVMDPDEQSRIEKDDDVQLIVRLPVLADDTISPAQSTVPLGIILRAGLVITICQDDSIVLEDLAKNRYRQCPLSTKEGFILSIIGRAAMVFIRLLKYTNRLKTQVEEKLHTSIKNAELIELLDIQKTLVYYTTSLTSNEGLLEKLVKIPYFSLNNEDEKDFLDDIIIDNKQAIEMANIYANILTGTMDAFASVISNNMNLIMKRLTVISIALMLPTFLTSFYGMNVSLPMMHAPFAWLFLLGSCLLTAVAGAWFLSDKRNHRIFEDKSARKARQKASKARKKRVKELSEEKRA